MVSGMDKILKNNIGNIEVLDDYDKNSKWIYANTFPTNNEIIDDYLNKNKEKLQSRKIRKFNGNNWFQLGAPRNISIMEKYVGEDCIYIRNITRKSIIAFRGKIGYFGASLIMLKPHDKEMNLDSVINYLNSEEFKKKFIYSGRFRIGHKQIANSIYKEI